MKRLLQSLLRFAWLGGLLFAVPAAMNAGPATAYTVDSTTDNPDLNLGDNTCADLHGLCTLRAAVMQANAHPGPDTILLPALTFSLTIPGASEDGAATGDLDLTGTVTLQGAGAANSIIDAAGLGDRAVDVLAGAQANLIDLAIRGGIIPTSGETIGGGLLNNGALTLTRVLIANNNLGREGGNRYGGGLANLNLGWLVLIHSQVASNEAEIGAIYNEGRMDILSSLVMSNVADFGGGILNNGDLTINASQVLSNSAGLQAGGIYNNSGNLTLNNSLVAGNTSAVAAGLWQERNGALNISGSTFRGNKAGSSGGGLLIDDGRVAITGTSLSGNSAGVNGGALWLHGGELAAANTTVALNSAGANGGGLYQNGGTFRGYNLTVASNIANDDDVGAGSGGGLFREISGTLALSNTILSQNLHAFNQQAFDDDCVGNFGAFHYNLIGTDLGCHFTDDHNLVAVNPQLQPLAYNGGPTQTMALGPGSAALDAGDPGGCDQPGGGLLLTDQRGLPRHADGNLDGVARCDIGAFEVELQLFLPVLRR